MLVLGAAELTVRVAGVDLVSDERLRYQPTLGWTSSPDWEPFDHVNPQGFRHQIQPANPDGHRRLVILGDSFSFGGSFPFAQTFSGRLQEWLGVTEGPEAGDEIWDVINLAAGGYGTGQQLLALREFGLDFEPDAVVLQVFPFNDLCNNNLRQGFTCSFLDFHRPYFVVDGDELRLTYLNPRQARIRHWSRLFGLLELRAKWGFPESWIGISGDRKSRAGALLQEGRAVGLTFRSNLYSLVPDSDQSEVIRSGWQVTERLIGEIADLLAERGVPLIGVVIPYVDTFDEDWPQLRPSGHPPLVADYSTERIERILREAGARVVSMRERILSGEDKPYEYFYPNGRDNDRHINLRGHFVIARWIVEELGVLGLSRRRAPVAAAGLCEADLRALDQQIRWLPQNALPQPEAVGQLRNLANIAAEAMRTCRTDVVVEMLLRLRSQLEEDSSSQHDSEDFETLVDEVDERLDFIRSGLCIACED